MPLPEISATGTATVPAEVPGVSAHAAHVPAAVSAAHAAHVPATAAHAAAMSAATAAAASSASAMSQRGGRQKTYRQGGAHNTRKSESDGRNGHGNPHFYRTANQWHSQPLEVYHIPPSRIARMHRVGQGFGFGVQGSGFGRS